MVADQKLSFTSVLSLYSRLFLKIQHILFISNKVSVRVLTKNALKRSKRIKMVIMFCTKRKVAISIPVK
jgi:hypothetical protein